MNDRLNYQAITNPELVERTFNTSAWDNDKILYPHPATAEDEIVARLTRQRQAGQADIITLVDGAFDVPHPNHEEYLKHCRLAGAYNYLLSRNSEAPTVEQVGSLATSSALHLVVTVDADAKVSEKKSGASSKGGVARPIYPWHERARRIANYTFDTAEGPRYSANTVTVEGDPAHVNTAYFSSLSLAKHLQSANLLDTLVVFGEHDTTVGQAQDLNLNPTVMPSTNVYSINPQTGRGYTSSGIIRRAQGQPVEYPITSPLMPQNTEV
ncbi:hypothetical protein FJZ39_01415 [Candidatus Saccharibacteria bacterium]|nr:hypothetical protein [Candidatus Saccharibacteria bacterium]